MAAVPDRPLDESTVAECHSALSKTLERYAWAIVRDWSLASDVVQSTFMAFSRFGGDVAPEARKSWLFKVVYREAIRVLECQKPYKQLGPEMTSAVLETRATYDANPLLRMSVQEDIELLAKQIGMLSNEQQQVLRLRFFENLTFSEIAEKESIPIGTALSRMRLALERLRSMSNENER